MTNIVLNSANCLKCSDYGFSPGTGAPTGAVPMGPGVIIQDAGRIYLTANVPKAVLFTQISVIDSTKWIFDGLPINTDPTDNSTVSFEITSKTGTGFTVTSIDYDSIFEYTCRKL